MKEFVAGQSGRPDKFNDLQTPPIGTTPQLQAEVLKLRGGLQKMATMVYSRGQRRRTVKALLSEPHCSCPPAPTAQRQHTLNPGQQHKRARADR